jgi:hypothetical protein
VGSTVQSIEVDYGLTLRVDIDGDVGLIALTQSRSTDDQTTQSKTTLAGRGGPADRVKDR